MVKMQDSLGQKIRDFRQERDISQFDLELEIGTSHGRISKIENDLINPDKETIVSIAKALQLDTPEIASLFGLEVVSLSHLSDDIKAILVNKNVEEIVDSVVNDIIFKLGYIASAMFLREGDLLYMRGLTRTNISEKVLPLLSASLDDLPLSLVKDTDNLTVKAINESKEYTTYYTHEYIVPMVSKEIADKIQETAGDKSNIVFPLEIEGNKLGAVVYVKKVRTGFDSELETLRLVSDLIAAALYNAQSD